MDMETWRAAVHGVAKHSSADGHLGCVHVLAFIQSSKFTFPFIHQNSIYIGSFLRVDNGNLEIIIIKPPQ